MFMYYVFFSGVPRSRYHRETWYAFKEWDRKRIKREIRWIKRMPSMRAAVAVAAVLVMLTVMLRRRRRRKTLDASDIVSYLSFTSRF